MRLYDSYLGTIQEALQSTALMKGHYAGNNIRQQTTEHRLSDPSMYKTNDKLQPNTSMQTLASLLGRQVKFPKSGDHPDFTHLRNTHSVDYHHIVSVFMDVRNSTQFFKKYTLEQIQVIIQTIVSAATHTCALFDGHIQRMQYDGVFAYFGGRGVSREAGVLNAIEAASFFSYFVKYELPQVFGAIDVDSGVYARTGIDFGDDEDTLWSIYGTGDCTELTTTGLHTSLAPKMQSRAESNGVMVGDNVRSRLGRNSDLCEALKDVNGRLDYIFEDRESSFYYKQHKFKWQSYMKQTYDFVKQDDYGKLYIDYDANASLKEQERQRELANATRLLESGQGSLDKKFNIIPGTSGIVAPRERNYYGHSRRD